MKKKEENIEEVKPKKANNKLIASLYILCAVCWLISGILNYKASNKFMYITDFALTIVWICLAIFYFKKKNK